MDDTLLNPLLLAYRERADSQALAQVFDVTGHRLLALALHLSKSRDEAEDLVQSTFLAVMEGIERFDGQSSGMGWMLGILTNKARESGRAAARTPDPDRLELRSVDDPQFELEAGERREVLERAAARLPERYRSPLTLVLQRGLGPNEIARELGRKPGAVRVQLHRAMAMLRRDLPRGYALPSLLAVYEGGELEALRRRLVGKAPRSRGTLRPRLAKTFAGIASATALLVAWVSSDRLELPRPSSRVELHAPVPALSSVESVDEVALDSARATRQRAAAEQEPSTAPTWQEEVRDVWLGPGEGLHIASGRVLSGASSPKADFHLRPGGTPEAGPGRSLRLLLAPTEIHRSKGSYGAYSADCLLRSVVQVDPDGAPWEPALRWLLSGPRDGFLVRTAEDTFAAVAVLNQVLSPETQEYEWLVRYRTLPPGGIVRPLQSSDQKRVGTWVDPEAFDHDPFLDQLEARRRVLMDRLEDAIEAHPLHGLAETTGVHLAAAAMSESADQIDARKFSRVHASFSFTHGSLNDPRRTANDAEVRFSNAGMQVRLSHDDRSRLWPLDSLDPHDLRPEDFIAGSLVAEAQTVALPEPLLSYLIHTLDRNTDRWDLVKILTWEQGAPVLFAWRPLDSEDLREACERATEDPRRELQLPVQLQIRAAQKGAYTKAYLDGSLSGSAVRKEFPLDFSSPMDPEAAQVWVQGGRIPHGHALQVRSVTWQASPTSPGDSCYVQLRLGDQQLLREFGFSSPIDGQWSGNLVLPRGSERSSFLEVGPHTQADILIDASLVPE